MIDINFFARKAAQVKTRLGATPTPQSAIPTRNIPSIVPRATVPQADKTQQLPLPNRAESHVTYRGVVYPWQLDHMDHMNVRHYIATFDEASWVLLAQLGMDSFYFQRNHRSVAAMEQNIVYKSEMRSGEAFEIRSRVVEVREKTLRITHDMHKMRTGSLAASSTILGVHIDSDARRSVALPAFVVERTRDLSLSVPHSLNQEFAATGN